MTNPAGDDDVAFAGVIGQLELLRLGKVTPSQLIEASLGRLAASQPRLNAFRAVLGDSARAAAATIDADAAGPLSGIPIAIKDNTAVAGQSALLGTGSPEPIATSDGELVARIRGAGAIPIGLTHLPELALFAATESRWIGISRNPWDLDRTPGGSSGGSAAAVAAGIVPAAHATDGLGSIRIPASCCGLVGLKATHGLVPFEGGEHWLGLSHGGFLTRSVADTALMIDVVAGTSLSDEIDEVPPLRIAVSGKPSSPVSLDPDVRAGLDATARRLSSLGHHLDRRDPPVGNTLGIANLVRYLAGMSDDRARLVNPDAVEPRTRQLDVIGRNLPGSAKSWARTAGSRFADRMRGFFGSYDVLLTPTMPILPVRAGDLGRRGLVGSIRLMLPCAAFTGQWNACGFPAMSIPAATTAGGLPIGMQLIGLPGTEARLLALAAQLEAAIGWTARRPAPLSSPV